MATKALATKKAAGASADAARDLRRAEEFRKAMTELAVTLDKAARLAADLLDRYPNEADYHGHHIDLNAVWATTEVFAGVLRSGGCAD